MRIVICDDHFIFAEALAVVLRSRGHVVSYVTAPDDAVAAVTTDQVDVCIMDLSFPGASGIDGTTGVLAASPDTRVVVLTGSDDATQLTDAMRAGAHGITSKTQDLDRIIDVLDRVHAGERVLGVVESLPSGREPSRNRLERFLTEREKEVLRHLALGESTADLARAMGIRYSTARTHIQSALTKLGVHSKLEAVVYAVSNNLVPFPEAKPPEKEAGTESR